MSETALAEQKMAQIAPEDLSEDDIWENPLDIDPSIFQHPNTKYTAEQKIAAITAYIVTGTSRKAAKLCGINEATIRDWKTRSSWWPEAYNACIKRKQEELDAAFTNIVHKAVDTIEDRLENGDVKMTKSGELIRVPMTGKEVAWAMGITFDKRQLLRGEATSRTERISEDDRLDNLKKQFEKMATEIHGYNAKTIESNDYEVQNEETEDVGKSE